MKIAVAGLGYVGLSNSLMMAQNCDVVAFDICESKVNNINENKIIVQGDYIDRYMSLSKISLRATTSIKESFGGADYIIIALPTDYNIINNKLDTTILEDIIISALKINPSAIIIIKSTVPVGFTKNIKMKYNIDNIVYTPEFLREKTCLNDVLYPSRIIIGDKSDVGRKVANVLLLGVKSKNTPVLFTDSTEAEAIKLFSNAYLAMRLSFFNEMDSFASINELNIDDMIEGISLDPRIGDYYNKPSIFYGGYCLPKDTRQLLADFNGIPQSIISAIVNANITRTDFVVKDIMSKKPNVIGFYKMLKYSLRNNLECDMVGKLVDYFTINGAICVAYETDRADEEYITDNIIITDDFKKFKERCSIIIANTWDDELLEIKDKVYRHRAI